MKTVTKKSQNILKNSLLFIRLCFKMESHREKELNKVLSILSKTTTPDGWLSWRAASSEVLTSGQRAT